MTSSSSDTPPSHSRASARGEAIHQRLREATRASHGRLERRVGLVASPTLERYAAVLRAFFGYYAPLEARMVSAWPTARLPFVARSRALARDLADLGERVHSLPLCLEVPPIATRAALAGCAYVVEGAALGGQAMARELGRKLGVRAAFFAGDGAQTRARFAEVLAWIDEVDAKSHCRDEIVGAACDTFASFERWIARSLEP